MKNMKKSNFISLMLLWCFTMMLAACSSGDSPEEKSDVLVVNASSVAFKANKDLTQTFVVVSSAAPKVTADSQTWYSVSTGAATPSASNLSTTVTVTAKENTTTEKRSGTITISCGAKTTTVAVSQEAGEKAPDPIVKNFDPLSNANATKEAKNVYNFLKEIYGSKMLSGVQASMPNTLDRVNAVGKLTGKHPALAGFDYIFLAFSPTPDGWSWVQNYNDISAAKEQWENNGLVNFMWHWNVPNSEEDFNNCVNKGATENMSFYIEQTSFDIREALKEGTWQNKCILRDIEEVAGYLKLLQDAKIPVIFRPLHEAAGNYTRYNPNGGAWFWWGRYGAKYCKQLYILLYDKLVKEHGLNNLIWVWTVDVAPGYEDAAKEWYPGDEYVDIVGADVYTTNNAIAWSTQYTFMTNLVSGKKMTTVSECGNMPEPSAQFKGGANWLWFMVWPLGDEPTSNVDNNTKNTETYWKSVFGNSNVLNREDMPSLK